MPKVKQETLFVPAWSLSLGSEEWARKMNMALKVVTMAEPEPTVEVTQETLARCEAEARDR